MAIARIGWTVYLSWTPALLFAMLMRTVRIGMIASAASLFFHGVKYIVEVFLTFGIFFTPVVYDVRVLGSKAKWFLFKPAASIFDGLRACIARHQSWISLVRPRFHIQFDCRDCRTPTVQTSGTAFAECI